MKAFPAIMMAQDLEQLSFPFFLIKFPEVSSRHIATMPATNLTSFQFKISPVIVVKKDLVQKFCQDEVPKGEFWPMNT